MARRALRSFSIPLTPTKGPLLMMTDIIWCNQFNSSLFKAMTADVLPEQWRAQPPGLQNHAAWQIGHVTYSRANVAALLGKPGPVSSADLKVRFGTGSSPEPHSVGGDDKEALLGSFWAMQNHVAEAIASTSPDVLNAPTPSEGMRARFPLVRDVVRLILTSHDALHLGQLSAWRHAMGLPRILG